VRRGYLMRKKSQINFSMYSFYVTTSNVSALGVIFSKNKN